MDRTYSDEEFYTDDNLIDDENNVVDVSDSQEQEDECDDSCDYEIISSDKIAEVMDARISEVSSVTSLPKTITRILLGYFKWDQDKLIEKYFDGDQKKIFTDAQIVHPFDQNNVNNLENDSTGCKVCYTMVDSSEMSGLPCGHLFCTECWENYLKTKITSGESDSIPCLAFDCGIIVDDDTIMNLLKNPIQKKIYQRLIMNSFVKSNKLFRWCPSPDCNKVVKVRSTEPIKITCDCKYVFCFGCGDSWHEPISCDYLRKWLIKCRDDSETLNWMKLNTKDCPNCKTVIEKNGGCNIMNCKNCGKDFCWICLGFYGHQSVDHACNLYNENLLNDSAVVKLKDRAALGKYLFYNSRYVSHQQSLKKEEKLYEAIETRKNELVGENRKWINVKCLSDAVDILRSCRQTLSYTYAFAFYSQKNNQTMIFEDNQNDLHFSVENLSGFLEKTMIDETNSDSKVKVLDLSKYCEERRKILVKHVQEGFEKNWWILSE